MGVNPQDSWLGVPAPTQACCPSRKCSQNQKMPLCAGRGPGSHRGGSLPPPRGSLREQKPYSKSPSRSMEGGGEARACGSCLGRPPWQVQEAEEHPQCPLSSHHSPVQPVPSTFWEGLPPGHLDHFWSMSLCPHPRANSKEKRNLCQNLRACQGSKHHTPHQHPVQQTLGPSVP